MYQLLSFAVTAIFLLNSGVVWYAMRQAANIELPQNSALGVRTALSKQSLRNWNIANFAGRHLMGVQAGIFLLGAVTLGSYGIFFEPTILWITVLTAAVLLSVAFFYIANTLVANKAIKEYVDVA